MSAVKVSVTLDINGENVSAEDASWYLIAPCGCTTGACTVDMLDGYNLTEDAALSILYRNPELRRRGIKAGYTAVLSKRSEAVQRLTAKCSHVPAYGVPVVPVPDGYAWAETWDYSRSHLVRAEHVDETREGGTWPKPVAALCISGEPKHADLHYWHKPRERVTCRRCERAAIKRAGGDS